MEHNRKTKVITMVALIVAVLGLSIGLSAYSKTLNIQNVQASVAGNQSNFNVVFSTSSTEYASGSVVGGASGYPGTVYFGNPKLSDTTISNITGSFSQRGFVGCDFYVLNTGSIPAYLTGITFGNKICTGSADTNSELVEAACNDISVVVQIHNKSYYLSNKITDSPKLDPGKSELVQVRIEYTGIHGVDGSFTATIPSITFTYSSQQNQTS